MYIIIQCYHLCFAHCYFIYCILCTATRFIAALHIVYCVLPFVCTVGTAVLCAGILYCCMLYAMGTTVLCIACDVLVPQI